MDQRSDVGGLKGRLGCLPFEMVLRALSLLCWQDLVKIPQLNTWYRNLFETEAMLKYLLELGLAGLVERPGVGPTSVTEGLRELQRIQDIWRGRETSWELKETFRRTHQGSHLEAYDQIRRNNGMLFEVVLPDSLKCSTVNGLWSTTISNLEFLGGDCSKAINWTENVLAFATAEMKGHEVFVVARIYAIGDVSSPKLLKDLTHSVVPNDVLEVEDIKQPVLGISGHILVVSFPDIKALMVWDWKEGGDEPAFVSTTAHSYAFLPDQRIMVAEDTFLDQLQLSIYHIEHSVLGDNSTTTPKAVNLQLPILHNPQGLVAKIHSSVDDQTPAYSIYPFAASPADGLYIVHFVFRHHYVVMIPMCTLRRVLTTFGESGTEEVVIPWDQWGPAGTRMTQATSDFMGGVTIFGGRILCCLEFDEEEAECATLDIYDYSPVTRRQSVERPPKGPYPGHSTVAIEKGSRFAQRVTSSYPYALLEHDFPENFLIAMAGPSWILGTYSKLPDDDVEGPRYELYEACSLEINCHGRV